MNGWMIFGGLTGFLVLFIAVKTIAQRGAAGQRMAVSCQAAAAALRPARPNDITASAGAGRSVIADHLGLPLSIRYRNAKAETSNRDVTVMRLIGEMGDGGMMRPYSFLAVCRQRRALRSFRLDRVEEAIDGATGEVIGDLGQHLVLCARDRIGAGGTK